MNQLPVSVTCDRRQLQAVTDGSRECTGQRNIDLRDAMQQSRKGITIPQSGTGRWVHMPRPLSAACIVLGLLLVWRAGVLRSSGSHKALAKLPQSSLMLPSVRSDGGVRHDPQRRAS